MSAPCLFCRIAAREVPSDIVAEDHGLVAIRDLHPQAPTHLLIIPVAHIAQVSDLTDADAPLVARAVLLANRAARAAGIADSGYRLVLNCGAHGGQSVAHVHLHLLGGRPMKWPPG